MFGYRAAPQISKIVVTNRNEGGEAHTEFNTRIAGATIGISWDKAGNDVLWSGKFGGIKDMYAWTLPHGMALSLWPHHRAHRGDLNPCLKRQLPSEP